MRCGGIEYRGYDSAVSPPLKTATSSGAVPKVSCATSNSASAREPLQGHTGIGHTRWAPTAATPRTTRTRS